jgi:metal-sulfur cluster biosynthetic enzyme
MTVYEARVLGALSDVRDPELDEPITELGFVSDLEIEGEAVNIRLRLPTYFCAPNFAYLMVADAREAILSVPGVRCANVILDDHYASDEINGGVNEGQGFDGAFPGETEGPNLGELRSIFQRKSFVSRQEKLCRALLVGGRMPAELVLMRVGVGGCGVRLRRARRVPPHLPPMLPPATPMENDLGSSMNRQTDPS